MNTKHFIALTLCLLCAVAIGKVITPLPQNKPALAIAPTQTPWAEPLPTKQRIELPPTPALLPTHAPALSLSAASQQRLALKPDETLAKDNSLIGTPRPLPPTSTPVPTSPPPATVGKAIVVDQHYQALRVYENGAQVRSLPVSTGLATSFTPAFKGYVGYYAENLWGYGYWVDHGWYITTSIDAIFIHGAPYVYSGTVKIYAGLEHLGIQSSSHGCIRLSPQDAEWLAQWNPIGVPILITPSQPRNSGK